MIGTLISWAVLLVGVPLLGTLGPLARWWGRWWRRSYGAAQLRMYWRGCTSRLCTVPRGAVPARHRLRYDHGSRRHGLHDRAVLLAPRRAARSRGRHRPETVPAALGAS